MRKTAVLCIIAGLSCVPALADPVGKLKICRHPGVTGLMDGKKVQIPADTYTGTCDKYGDHCRDIQILGEAATIGPSKGACVTVSAKLIHSDGMPIKKGEKLAEQWSIPGFAPTIRAATDFR